MKLNNTFFSKIKYVTNCYTNLKNDKNLSSNENAIDGHKI